MNPPQFLRRAGDWLAPRASAFGRVAVALCLNVPLFLLALGRITQSVDWTGFAGLYAVLAFLGYYVSLLLFLLVVLFLVTGIWRRLFVGAAGVLLTLALFYFVVDGIVFRVLRMHVDAFWIEYVLTSFSGLGLTLWSVLGALGLLAAIAALEWWVFRVAERVRRRKLWGTALVAGCVLSFALSQVIHIAAYEANDTRITAITPELPFYFPVTSHHNAVKYGELVPLVREARAVESEEVSTSFRYPLTDVSCTVPPQHRRPNVLLLLQESWRFDAMDPVVTPHLYELSRRSSVFLNHFSTGNSTPTGVYPLFYGLHSTYWRAVKANSAAIDNPPLMDALEANGYAFGIFAESHFERHKLKDAVFRGIEVHEDFHGESWEARDRDLTERLMAFMEEAHRAGRPFFGFAFYKSTHYSYYYPEDDAPFQPTRELSVVRASADDDPGPVLNDYRNSVHYVDELVGSLIHRMDEAGILDSTIVIVTGDHGEEFNDNGHNYWGHTGNFTRYQSQVPMIVYVPWEEPRRVTAPTSHVDVPPTILREGLGCGDRVEDYSNGHDLFGPLEEHRPVVVSSYVNHAMIMDGDVYVVYPMYVDKYRLDDVDAEAGPPPPDLMKEALEGMGRFYGNAAAPPAGRQAESGRSAAKAATGSVKPSRDSSRATRKEGPSQPTASTTDSEASTSPASAASTSRAARFTVRPK